MKNSNKKSSLIEMFGKKYFNRNKYLKAASKYKRWWQYPQKNNEEQQEQENEQKEQSQRLGDLEKKYAERQFNQTGEEGEKSEKEIAEQEERLRRLEQSGNGGEVNEEGHDEKLEQILTRVRGRNAGNNTDEEAVRFGAVEKKKGLLDWKTMLKRIAREKYISPKEHHIPETEIVVDTSYSVGDEMLRNFLRECKSILSESKVKVGCFDTRFYGFDEVKDENDIDNFQIKGRGGTCFETAVGAFSSSANNKIIFTDGEDRMPSRPLDAIWVVYGGRKIDPKGGQVVYIDEEEFKKLGSKQETHIDIFRELCQNII